MSQILLETVCELRGDYPKDIPFAPGVSLEEIKQHDPNPNFLTLPIGEVGQTSRNGRTYGRAAMESLVQAIQKRKIPGQLGHMRDEERAYRYDVPPILWVGAKLESNGQVWAKAYILPHAENVRSFANSTRAVNGLMATSLYGTGREDDKGGVTDLQVESIDIVDPSRAGVEFAVSSPVVTAEMDKGNAMKNKEKFASMMKDMLEMGMSKPDVMRKMANKANMSIEAFAKMLDGSEDMPQEMVESLSEEMGMMKKDWQKQQKESRMDTENATIVEQREKIRELTLKNTQLETTLRDLAKVREMLAADENADVVLTLQNLLTAKELAERENRDLLKETIAASVAAKVKLEAARPMIESLVAQQNPTRRSDISVALETVLKRAEVVEMLKLTAVREMGDGHIPAARNTQQENVSADLVDIPAY